MEEDIFKKLSQEQVKIREDLFFDYLGVTNNCMNNNNDFFYNIASSSKENYFFNQDINNGLNKSIFDDTISNKSVDAPNNNNIFQDKKVFNTEIIVQNNNNFITQPNFQKTGKLEKKAQKNPKEIKNCKIEKDNKLHITSNINQAEEEKTLLSNKTKREEKLYKNKMSARKCRQKKKLYVENLEEMIKEYQMQIKILKYEKEKERKENFSFDKTYKNLLHKEHILSVEENDSKKIEFTKKEYLNEQKILLNEIFIKQVDLLMPIDCKLFLNKFIKLKQINPKDSIDNNYQNIKSNMDLLNELYDFSSRKMLICNENVKGKENIAFKLFIYYERVLELINGYKENLKLLD